jgi:hypothetical protein
MSMALQTREPVTESQRKAVLRLNRAERELGADGSALVHDVLVKGMTVEQVGRRRRIKYKVRRRKGGTYPLSHLYGHFGLVRLTALGRDVPWVKA